MTERQVELQDGILLVLFEEKTNNNQDVVRYQRIIELLEGKDILIDEFELSAALEDLAHEQHVRVDGTKMSSFARIRDRGVVFIRAGGYAKVREEMIDRRSQEELMTANQLKSLEQKIDSFNDQKRFWIESAKNSKRQARIVYPTAILTATLVIIEILRLLGYI